MIAPARPRTLFKAAPPVAPGQPSHVTFASEDVGFVDIMIAEGWHRTELIRLTGDFASNPPRALCQVCGADGYVVDSMIDRELWDELRGATP